MPETPQKAPKAPVHTVRANSIVLVNTGGRQGKIVGSLQCDGTCMGSRLANCGHSICQGRNIAGRPTEALTGHLGIEWQSLGNGVTWESTNIDLDEVVAAVKGRIRTTNVFITNSDAPQQLIEIADTTTEMRMIKHGYDSGIRAIKRIEY